LLASATRSIFTEINWLETFHPSRDSYRLRLIVIRGMAGITIYLSHLYCLGALIMAGNKSAKPEKILRAYLSRHVCLEYIHHLVDLECFASRRYGRISSQ
jgi:hypothetical protein